MADLLSASSRSDVPPFMVMDVMAAAERIEAAGGHVIHMEVGQPAAPAPKTALAAARAALERRPDRLHLGARHPVACARASRGIIATPMAARSMPSRIVVTTGSSGAFILAFLAMFEPGDRVAVTVPGYPPYRHILTALGCEPVLIETIERDAPCADRRGVAGGASQEAAAGRAGRQSRQSDGNHDVARGAHRR